MLLNEALCVKGVSQWIFYNIRERLFIIREKTKLKKANGVFANNNQLPKTERNLK